MKIIDIARLLFPRGYVDWDKYRNGGAEGHGSKRRAPSYRQVPYLCSDLFALTALLLQRSGAYHHVAPANNAEIRSSEVFPSRILNVKEQDRQLWQQLGKQWRGDGRRQGKAPPKQLRELWSKFRSFWDDNVYTAVEEGDPPPRWWRHALALMCIADEAALGLGFKPPVDGAASFQSRLIELVNTKNLLQYSTPFTFSTANTDVACVLPKSRTPKVGCTLRSLTHHLALLPPRGLARAYWLPFTGSVTQENDKTLNCLLVPLPYRIAAQSVRPFKLLTRPL